MRIASFLPAATTICYDLGLGDAVSCVTFECQFPPAAKAKPKVIRCIFNSDTLSSAAIETAVSDSVATSTPLYEIEEELLRETDIVLIQDLCEVCAIGPAMVLPVLEKLQTKPRIVQLTARSLDGLYDDIMKVAAVCDVHARGEAMVLSMKARVDRVVRSLAGCTPLKTVCVEWLDPIYNAGHWMPDLVRLAGGYDPLAAPESFSVAIQWTHVAQAGAEVLVIMPCGFDLSRTCKEASEILPGKDGWRDVPAVYTKRVWGFDGNRLFSGASPALVDGLEILASILHPHLYTLDDNARRRFAGDFARLDL
ncbi:Aste57867_21262 [Aphanomyces stellatus]|uniref:Aste57867_21262 protein n=1 Tax=Aphanomyces stellatus TaxID=120398 RepID=A0A485LH51_9STRA|nr:hypothetical protein As57867_021193 [Aphanomyces stellatus]VFT97934.1 Aste57867_21262 [Aphanomyces stellatus]